MAPEPHILCTAQLSDALVAQAATQGVRVEVLPFIRNEHLDTEALRGTLAALATTTAQVIFTSVHAVEGVRQLLPTGTVPPWTVHAVGERTRDAVAAWSGQVRIGRVAPYAEELAQALIADGMLQSAVFFCGDQRLDTLPTMLATAGISVEEVVVYRTIATPQRITNAPDGILFLSPSAVESFFRLNTLDDRTVPFAIGRTTAQALAQRTPRPVVVPAVPSREALLNAACAHFHVPSPDRK